MADRQPAVNPAALIHSALLAGPLIFAAAVFYLHSQAPASAPVSAIANLEYVAYIVAAAAYAAAIFFRGRIQPPAERAAPAWWRATLPRMIVLWALIEGPMMLGVAVFLLSRQLPVLIAITGMGALLLLLFSPGRLSGR